MPTGCCSSRVGMANLRSDRSRARGRPKSNGVEYLDDIPVTAEGSINMVTATADNSDA